MPKALSLQQIERYERDGALFPVAVLTAAEAARHAAALAEIEARLGGPLKRIDNVHLFFRWAYDLAVHPRVVDVVEDLLGPDLFVHSTRILCKRPHDGSYVSWHQDGIYSDLRSKPAPSIWIALTDSSADNGCVRVIPGSHKSDKLPHHETFAADNLLNDGEEVAVEVDEAQAVDMALQPGEMSVHHVNMIHGSNANRSDRPRIGFAVSFITPEVRRSHLPVVRVRGTSDDHEFDLVPAPPALGIDAALAAHAELIASHGLQKVRVG